MNPLLDPNARMVIAHRGDQGRHPENTIEALQAAVDLGVDALEFDVRMTRDWIPVVIHDDRLDRTTDGKGSVGAYTLAELRSFNAAATMAGHPRAVIPTLEEVLDRFRMVPLVIEVKEAAAAGPTEHMVRRFSATERVVVGSSHDSVTHTLYRTGLACCASMVDALRLIPPAVLGLKPSRGRYQVLSITPNYHGVPIPVRALAGAAQKLGIPVHVWTVNEPGVASAYFDAGVSAILSDFPAAILGVRRR